MNDEHDRSALGNGALLAAALACLIALPLGTFDVLAARDEVPRSTMLAADLLKANDPAQRRRAARWLGEQEDRNSVDRLPDGRTRTARASARRGDLGPE